MLKAVWAGCAVAVLILGTTAGFCQVRAAAELGRPKARIPARVDDGTRVTLPGSVHRAVAQGHDLGRVPENTATGPMRLMLRATPEQEHDLTTLVDLQGDAGSGSFHKWLTPEEFGARFGAHDADIAKLSRWLQSHGLTVDRVAKGKRAITFHGTSGQLERAFGTEMHRLSVHGEEHIANTKPVTVPAAFASVVLGVSRLNDFHPRQPHTPFGRATRGSDGRWHSAFTSGDGSYYMTPGDFATIYNTKPLLNAGYDGTGVTIGIVAWSEIPISDVQTFRSLFGLKKNDPEQIILGVDQGIDYGGEGEAELDVEWSGAAAPGATILFPVAPNTYTSDFLGSSLEYLVDSNKPDVISASVAECEEGTGTFLVPYYEQAAAQGISVFASASDSGSDGCDDFDTAMAGTTGYGVNGWSSTPFNTSVGGTMFDDFTDGSQYWNATDDATYSSAKGYIPEEVWNESGASANQDLGGIWAGSGGVSELFARPAWQAGPGVPAEDPITVTSSVAGPHRSIPDVSLTAAVHDGYLTCFDDGSCQGNAGGIFGGADVSGGTSASSPSYAGIQALIDQKYGRQGVVNYQLYQLAARQNAADCNSTSGPASTCVFNDVTVGSNAVPCAGGTPDCPVTTAGSDGVYAEFPAGTGYDFATGLGSVNANNLFQQWGTVSFRSTQTLLSASSSKVAHGAGVTLTAYVNPGSGSGTPTGDVSFYAQANGQSTGYGFATLSGNQASELLQTLPAGTYQVVARYAGDDTFGASYSNPVMITVGSESSTTTLTPEGVTAAGYYNPGQTSFHYGDQIYLSAVVAGASGQGAPTGNVTLTEGSTKLATQGLRPSGDSPLAGATGSDTLFTLSPVPGVTVGQHTYVVSYAGDASFGASKSSSVSIAVSPGTPVPSVSGNFDGAGAAAGRPVTLTVSIPALGPAVPTGTVTFYNGSTAIGAPVALKTSGGAAVASVSFTPAAGATSASVTAQYSGDGNYTAAASAAFLFSVESGTTKTVTVLSAPATGAYGTPSTLTATVTAVGSTGALNGTVDFYSNGAFIGSAGMMGTTATLSAVLPGGTDKLSAVYQGSPADAGSTSNTVTTTVSKNTPAVTLTVSPLSIALGQSVSLTGYVPAVSGASIPTGTIAFYDGTTLLNKAAILGVSNYGNSYARFEYTPKTAGNHQITATYSGDGNYGTASATAATLAVSAAAQTATTFSLSPVPATLGETTTLSVSVVRVGSTGTPTGTVTLYANGSAVLSTALSGGAVSLPISTAGLPPGKYLLQVDYAGDSGDAASRSEEQTVELRTQAPTSVAVAFSPANPAAGSNVTVTATVSEVNAGLAPTGAVAFYYGGTYLGSGTLNNGVASFTKSTSGVPPGGYAVTAKYAGDLLNAASQGSATVTLH